MNDTPAKGCHMMNVIAPSPCDDTATSPAPENPCHQQNQTENGGVESTGQKKSSLNTSSPLSVSPCPPRKVSTKKKGKQSEEEGYMDEVLERQLIAHEMSSKPRRPLSAYNLYFSEERERILAQIPEPSKEEKKQRRSSPSCGDVNSGAFQEALCKLKEKIAKAPKLNRKEQDALDELVRMKTKSTLDTHRERNRRRRAHKKTHGKISFHLLASLIGERWRSLPKSDRAFYEGLAEQDCGRYRWAMVIYERQRKKILNEFRKEKR